MGYIDKGISNTYYCLNTFFGFCTYQENKSKDRKAFVLQYCASTNTIPLNIKVAAQRLKNNKDKASFEVYRIAINEFLARLETENSSMGSISKKILSLVPAMKEGRPEFKTMLNSKNIKEESFVPDLIYELKKIQKEAIESCVKKRTESP